MKKKHQFKMNKTQLAMHHAYTLIILSFFAFNSCVLAAVFAEPMLQAKIDGLTEKFMITLYLTAVIIVSGFVLYQEYSKLYIHHQVKKKRANI